MVTEIVKCLVAAITLFVATAAPGLAADGTGPISRESTDNFLNRVPDFAGGKPSANMLNSTETLRQSSGAPYKTPSGPSVISIDPPPARTFSVDRLTGGTIEYRTVTPYSIPGNNSTSPWGR